VRRHRLRGLRAGAGHLAVRTAESLGAVAVADGPAGGADRPRRAQPDRRPVAQPGPGPDRDAAAGVLRAALRRPAAQPVKPGDVIQKSRITTLAPRCGVA